MGSQPQVIGTDALRVLQINTNHSVKGNETMFKTAELVHANVICVQEPYILDGRIPLSGVRGWVQVVSGRAAVLVDIQIGFEQRFANNDVICLDISGIALINVYIAPPTDFDFMPYIAVLNTLCNKFNKVILVGDFNSRIISKYPADERTTELDAMFSANKLIILNDGSPTFSRVRMVDGGVTVQESSPDLSLVSPTLLQCVGSWEVLEQESASDHLNIFFTVSWKINSSAASRNFRKINYEKLDQAIGDENFPLLETTCSDNEIDLYVDQLTTRLIQLQEACSTQRPKPSHPWWNDKLEKMRTALGNLRSILRRKRNRAYKLVILVLYKCLNKHYRYTLDKTRENSWRIFCSPTRPWGPVYNWARARGSSSEIPELVDSLGNTYSGSLKYKHLLESKFPREPGRITEDQNRLYEEFVNHIRTPVEYNEYVTYDLLNGIIRKLKRKKAAGVDGITTTTFRLLFYNHSLLLMRLFDCCISRRYFPKAWKVGKVVFIPKPGKPRNKTDGYRPITLLPILGKVFEKVINYQYWETIEQKGLISEFQFGFRKGKSCEDAIHALLHNLAVLRNRFAFVAIVSLDVQAAFDTVWWPMIMKVLRELGFPLVIIDLFHSYCQDRVVKAGLEGVLEELMVMLGCPQGSISGPTIWLLFYNRILTIAREYLYIQAFADDTVYIVGANSQVELDSRVNEVMEEIATMLEEGFVKLNAAKTQIMVFYKKADPSTDHFFAHRGTHLVVSKQIKYLGVIIDDKLSWDSHIDNMVSKAKAVSNSLEVIMRNVYGYSNTLRRIMYRGLVVAFFSYCASVCLKKIALKGTQKKLLSAQRGLVLRIARAYRTAATDKVLVVAGIPPLYLEVIENGVTYFAKKGIQTRKYPFNYPELYKVEPKKFTYVMSPMVRLTYREVKDRLRKHTIRLWQKDWDKYDAFMKTMFPNISDRLQAPDVACNYWSSQILTGHGEFRDYLYTIKRTFSRECPCGGLKQKNEHIVYDCPESLFITSKYDFIDRTNRKIAISKEFDMFARELIEWLKRFNMEYEARLRRIASNDGQRLSDHDSD